MLEDERKIYQVNARRRLIVVSGGIGLVFSVLTGRLFHLQVMKGGSYRNLSDENRISLHPLPSSRGRIFDRHNKILVENRPDYQLAVTPELAGDLLHLLLRLKPELNLTDKEIQTLLDQSQKQRSFLPLKIKSHLSWEQLSRVSAKIHSFPGITIQIQPLRHYPQGTLAAHILGYLGEVGKSERKRFSSIHFRSGDLVGKSGLERRLEPKLRGLEGFREMEVNAIGRQIRELKQTPAQPGEDLQLTLDMDLQREAEKALGSLPGALVAMDPNTGEILAMVSHPTYNPNKFISGFSSLEWKKLISDPDRPLTNKAIQGQYPPGSTFKMAVVMAALAQGKLTPRDRYTCQGFTMVKKHKFYCWNIRGHGRLDIVQAIAQSCDAFFYHLAELVGIDAIQFHARRMGFGTLSGVDLDGEKTGLVPSRKWKRKFRKAPWYPGETLITAIGQGYLLATPIQLAVMMSSIANGGMIFRPILDRSKVLEKPIPLWHNQWKPEHLALLRKGLETVVEGRLGTGRHSKLEGVRMAAKTGTSQVVRHRRTESGSLVRSDNYRYKDHALFVAYAPAENPEIVLSVVVEHGGGGGANAAPVAKKVMDFFFAQKKTGTKSYVPS